jgi:hypothetical protein
MSDELPRNFKGIWIPREIWLHKELTCFEKMLWAEIDSLDHPENGCTASNAYLQKFFNINERTLQRGLAKLKNLGFIRYETFDGRLRSIKSFVQTYHDKFDTPPVTKMSPLGCQNCHPENKEEKKEKSPPPSSSKREPSPPLQKDDWKRRISSNWTNEEFEHAWGCLERLKNPTIRIQGYLETCMQEHRNSNGFAKERETRTDSHRLQAKRFDGKKINGDLVSAKRDGVEFSCVNFYRSIDYDIPDSEWIEQTKRWFNRGS